MDTAILIIPKVSEWEPKWEFYQNENAAILLARGKLWSCYRKKAGSRGGVGEVNHVNVYRSDI